VTREQKRHLAGALTTAAAEMVAQRAETYGLTDEQARAEAEQVGRWLAHLTGYEWDIRLPHPTDEVTR
jgi:hypothetical protein